MIFIPFSLSAIGVSDWMEKTPQGNEINNINGISLYLKNQQQVNNLWKSYFYKDHVVGMTTDPADSKMRVSYFIVNEKTLEIKKFDAVEKWQTDLKLNDLEPKFWTRWYFGDWTFFNDDVFFLGIVLIIPFAIFLFMLYKSIKKEKFKLFKPYTSISVLLFLLMLFYWLSDQFPQSI